MTVEKPPLLLGPRHWGAFMRVYEEYLFKNQWFLELMHKLAEGPPADGHDREINRLHVAAALFSGTTTERWEKAMRAGLQARLDGLVDVTRRLSREAEREPPLLEASRELVTWRQHLAEAPFRSLGPSFTCGMCGVRGAHMAFSRDDLEREALGLPCEGYWRFRVYCDTCLSYVNHGDRKQRRWWQRLGRRFALLRVRFREAVRVASLAKGWRARLCAFVASAVEEKPW